MLDFQILFSSKFMQDRAMPIRRRGLRRPKTVNTHYYRQNRLRILRMERKLYLQLFDDLSSERADLRGTLHCHADAAFKP